MYKPDQEHEIKFVFKETFTADMVQSLADMIKEQSIEPKAKVHINQGESPTGQTTTVVRFVHTVKGRVTEDEKKGYSRTARSPR